MSRYYYFIFIAISIYSCVEEKSNFFNKEIESKLLNAREYALNYNLEQVMASDSLANDTLTNIFSVNINGNHFQRYITTREFSYFVLNGWKGTTFGILLSGKEEFKSGFYDLNKIDFEKSDSIMNWYFASSKIY